MADETKTTTVEERLAALEQHIQSQNTRIESLATENAALQSALDKKAQENKPEELPTIPNETFEVGGKRWKFVSAHFRWSGEVVTAVDALADETLLRELVKMESGLIVEVAK